MRTRNLNAQLLSVVVHLAGLALLLLVMNRAAAGVTPPPVAQPAVDLVYVPSAGPAGGASGGGNPAPVRAVMAPPKVAPPEPVPLLAPVAVVPESDLLHGFAAPTLVALPAGNGRPGTGAGPGTGPGVGPGAGPGVGDGPGVAGTGGIEMPIRIREIKPQYTAEAMRAKMQGDVVIEGVLDATGKVVGARVVKSLDAVFGLDQRALEAARATPFRPCRKNGQPVACVITFVLTFSLR